MFEVNLCSLSTIDEIVVKPRICFVPPRSPTRNLHRHERGTPGLHSKIPALKIFARGWAAQESIFYTINAKIFQGLGPKRRESCNGDRV